ncbi:MAG: GNAT family N-acetyltransferase [Candidatus Thermoplasmatota archaeon]|jgi:GNAT superfamily N-acetyltransferase|nr:GNAT family N-acetyltransferase [Candidatus Thermoplasmatota archaeon]
MSGQGKAEGEQSSLPQKKEPASIDKSASPSGAQSPPLTIIVSQATHSDIPDICALYKKVWDEHKGKIPAEFEKTWQPSPLEFTSQMEGVTFFAARKDKKLIGILGCAMADGSARLVHIAVEPEHRKLGVGGALVASGIEWAKKSNASSIWTEPLTRFTHAIQLFKKLGFQEAGIFHRHLWKEDVQILEIVF